MVQGENFILHPGLRFVYLKLLVDWGLVKDLSGTRHCLHIPVNYKQFVWNRVSVPKHRFIAWLVVNSKLLTRDHLHRVMQLDSSLCPVCDQEMESHSHLLFGYCFSQQVVQKVHDWFGCSWPLIYSDWCRWIGGMSKGVRASKVAAVFSATVYYLWHNRNICVVHNYSLSIMAVVELIKKTLSVD
ncbi:uncharacterized protein LOC133806752 [Humulus lupulus]|uniref:uncharacterized protein LOC133806752 n=1 Tax=Humulus lupulus TaxID=3486 RepID=UPI002B40F1A6|nr:uncharacterized protein LOC133806752 [Humulus lupulus]